MKLRVFQFDRILEAHAPRLHAHFKIIRLAPDILVRTRAKMVSRSWRLTRFMTLWIPEMLLP